MELSTANPSVSVLARVLWQRHRWHLAFGVILAVAAIALGVLGLQAARADSAPSSFVSIAPTRVLDTRIGVGLPGALTSAQPLTLDVTGQIPVVLPGDIASTGTAVPDGATAIVANVTIVGPTTPGFVSVRPGTATGTPTTSNLNAATDGIVLPNSVSVELPTTGATAGQIQLWFQGTTPTATTHLLVDIVGYYTTSGLASSADVAALQAQVTALQSQVDGLQTLLTGVSRITLDGQPTLQFSDMNVQIVDGSGTTDGAVNGRGNLVIGYNETASINAVDTDLRTGSHNLVIGEDHSYSSYAGLVAGRDNTISGIASSVSGGSGNTATASSASVSGGISNDATALGASVSGGFNGLASGSQASVSGGSNNSATSIVSSVTGGTGNNAAGFFTTITGGSSNVATASSSSIAGGSGNSTPSGGVNVVAGGDGVACSVSGNSALCGEGTLTPPD